MVDGAERKLAAIMFTDMVGYSALAQRNEALALALLAEHQSRLRPMFLQHGGREIKSTGDGFLVEFGSALQAVRCAIAIQTALVEQNASAASDRRIQVRIGLNLGDVEVRDGDVFGDGVNIAARIEPLADAGGICITGAVFDQVRNKITEPLVRLGQPELKNIHVPIDVYRVVLPWTPGAPVRSQGSAGSKRWPRRGIAALLATLLVVAGAIVWRYQQPAATTLPAAPSSAPLVHAEDRKSVAVLPFVNMSGNDADEYLSDGMSEEIITTLSKVSGLRVAARTSSFFFKGKNEDIEKIGEQLRVGTVLEGSVRKAGTKLRVTVQLINAGNGYHLWSETYDEDAADILAIETEVAQRVAGALKVTLLAGEQERVQQKPTENRDAYDLYLQGRYYWNRASEDGYKKAIECFDRAIEKDPRFALAYAGLADAYSASTDMYFSPSQCMPKAREMAQRALAIDPDLAEAHAALAAVQFYYDWNWAGAEQELRRAIALKPDYAPAHDTFGWLLAAVGREDEALAEFELAAQLDPLALFITLDGSVPYIWMRWQDDRALQQCRKALEMDPNFYWAYMVRGWIHMDAGDYDAAVADYQKARSLADTPWMIGSLGYVYARAGKVREAEDLLHALEQLSTQRYVTPYAQAQIVVGLGQTDRAFEWLNKMYEERSMFMTFLKMEPSFDPLRSDPRFTALLQKVGLDP